jgi:hypothetical protein
MPSAVAAVRQQVDIDRNVDRQLHSPELLSSQFSGVDFGTLPDLPAIDAGSPAPGDDPIRFGTGNMVSFSALGTSSTGTLYIRGHGDAHRTARQNEHRGAGYDAVPKRTRKGAHD